jgi:caffeoyl-CoA O-methyltransferase
MLKLLRPNGIIAINSVLWGGKVLDPSVTDKDTEALREISQRVYNDDRADGVTLVRKQ